MFYAISGIFQEEFQPKNKIKIKTNKNKTNMQKHKVDKSRNTHSCGTGSERIVLQMVIKWACTGRGTSWGWWWCSRGQGVPWRRWWGQAYSCPWPSAWGRIFLRDGIDCRNFCMTIYEMSAHAYRKFWQETQRTKLIPFVDNSMTARRLYLQTKPCKCKIDACKNIFLNDRSYKINNLNECLTFLRYAPYKNYNHLWF